MIKRKVDRRAPTRGGMTVSLGLHALLLLLLFLLAGREVSKVERTYQLTEIQYIEARYGEDVAAKVRLKQLPDIPNDPGRGVSTRSAVRPPEPEMGPPADSKRRVAEVEAPAFAAPEPAPALAAAPRLESKTYKKSRAPIVAKEDVTDPEILAEISAPLAGRSSSRERFRPKEASLASLNRTAIDPDPDVAIGNIRGSGPSLAAATEKADRLLAGANLGNGRATYRAPGAGIAPGSGQGGGAKGGSGKGIAEIAGLPSAGGRESSGRRTILDYGTGGGGGGGGGGLVGRGSKLVEPPRPESIIDEAKPSESKPVEDAADAVITKGVSMSISGQIQGRKILESAAPVYSDRARRNGWEGVVVVHFTVLPDGRVKDNAYFERTAAHRDLNQAAMEAIRKFRFAPLPSGERLEQWGLITIVFRLN